MFYSEQLNSYWIIPSLRVVGGLASRNKRGKNVGKYHLLLSGFRAGRATLKPKFDNCQGENGFRILEETFTKLANRR